MSWRKSWSKQNLDPSGSKLQLTPTQRSIWDDCLDLAEGAQITGSLCVAEGVQYTVEQLEAIFRTPKSNIASALNLFRRLKMLTPDGYITKWKKYQNEYQRQKGYRVRLQQKVTSKSTHKGTPPEFRVQNTDADTNKSIVVEQPHQTLINRYLALSGTPREGLTAEQVTGAYRRHSRSALALISESGGREHAVNALEVAAAYFTKKGLTWTLDTVAKHLPKLEGYRHELLASKNGLSRHQLDQLDQLATWYATQTQSRRVDAQPRVAPQGVSDVVV